MQEIRLSIKTNGQKAQQLFEAIDEFCEEKNLPSALSCLDELNDLHEVSIYTDLDYSELEAFLIQLLQKIDISNLIEKEVLPETNWVQKSLENLPPIRVNHFFIHGSHDRSKQRKGDLSIEIDAGLAFGTGHHATTTGCLEMINSIVECETPSNILDLGTGSGILAIALAKLIPSKILATDMDPIAIETANRNMTINKVEHLIETYCAEGFQNPVFYNRGSFDLIVANVLAQPLIEMAHDMAQFTSHNGSIILSGILKSFGQNVISAYEKHNFCHIKTIDKEEWTTIHLKQKSKL